MLLQRASQAPRVEARRCSRAAQCGNVPTAMFHQTRLFSYRYFLFKPRLYTCQSGPLAVQSKFTLGDGVIVGITGILLCEWQGEVVKVVSNKIFSGSETNSFCRGEIFCDLEHPLYSAYSFDVDDGGGLHMRCMNLLAHQLRDPEDMVSWEIVRPHLPPPLPRPESLLDAAAKSLCHSWHKDTGNYDQRIKKTLAV